MPRKVHKRFCKKCSAEFTSEFKRTRYCDICRDLWESNNKTRQVANQFPAPRFNLTLIARGVLLAPSQYLECADTLLEKRFWSKVGGAGDECWIWQGYAGSEGYGTININQYPHLAHRIAYMFSSASIPDGICVLHECDTPLCVNPSHLKLGTWKDNSEDRIKRGRTRVLLDYRSLGL